MSGTSSDRSWQAIRDELESRRSAINAEISAYPAPITGCDAQFNHLTEQRSALNRELARLDEASADETPGAARDFVASCPFLAGGELEK